MSLHQLKTSACPHISSQSFSGFSWPHTQSVSVLMVASGAGVSSDEYFLTFHRCLPSALSLSCVSSPHLVQTNEPEVQTPSSVPTSFNVHEKKRNLCLYKTRGTTSWERCSQPVSLSAVQMSTFQAHCGTKEGHFAGPNLLLVSALQRIRLLTF